MDEVGLSRLAKLQQWAKIMVEEIRLDSWLSDYIFYNKQPR